MSADKRIKLLFSAAKISLGCAAAIVISTLLGLEYSATAGLITVLSIQDTKRATADIAVRRLISFFTAIGISFISFKTLGYSTTAFAAYLFFFIIVCHLMKCQSAIVPVSVLITHILSKQQFSVKIIVNEFLLLFIGAAVGIVLNLYMHRNSRKMEETKKRLDDEIKAVLERMSARILISDKSDYNRACFDRLRECLNAAKETALLNQNNTFGSSSPYDLLYLEMRDKQCAVLYEMYKAVKAMDAAPEQGQIISEFLKKISREYHEGNDVKSLTAEADRIIEAMKLQKMPETRTEFENRALLYTLLIRIKEFLSIKQIFMESNV